MKKIMVVDDDREFLEEISSLLRSSGYDVVALSRGDEALAIARIEKIDLILLDLKMEGGSGFKTADELKCLPATAGIPLVAITGVFTEQDHILAVKACGFVRRLIKPLNPLDVIAAIEGATA